MKTLETLKTFILRNKLFSSSLFISILSGSASALFLISLNWVTNQRIQNPELIYGLPFAGLLIGFFYKKYGAEIEKGNNLILEEIEKPQTRISFKMAPMVWAGTLLTHLFGGSAGREGTAVQMGASIADQFQTILKFDKNQRHFLLIMGISSGFAAVFGTPLAAILFSFEIIGWKKLNLTSLFLATLVAFGANFVCHLFPIQHVHYQVFHLPSIDFQNFGWLILCGIIFGLCSLLFIKAGHFFSNKVLKFIPNLALKAFIGGMVILILTLFIDLKPYLGLGISTIQESFKYQLSELEFLKKMVLTAFTLAAGFKGGEVTPLFFIGATLGNLLHYFVPFSISALAAFGFVSVFSGATKTPFACIIMGCELFGFSIISYLVITCIVAYIFSGNESIYSAQRRFLHHHPLNILRIKFLKQKKDGIKKA